MGSGGKKQDLVILALAIIFSTSCGQEQKSEHYTNGQLKEKISYKSKKPHGEYESYYENGQISGQGTFDNGKMVAIWKYWYSNGHLGSETTYNEDGDLINLQAWAETGEQTIVNCTGIAILTYPGGKPMSQVSYRRCKMHGEWITWFEDGRIESERYYEDGIPVGIWKSWNPDGTIQKIENHNNGLFREEDLKP